MRMNVERSTADTKERSPVRSLCLDQFGASSSSSSGLIRSLGAVVALVTPEKIKFKQEKLEHQLIKISILNM